MLKVSNPSTYYQQSPPIEKGCLDGICHVLSSIPLIPLYPRIKDRRRLSRILSFQILIISPFTRIQYRPFLSISPTSLHNFHIRVPFFILRVWYKHLHRFVPRYFLWKTIFHHSCLPNIILYKILAPRSQFMNIISLVFNPLFKIKAQRVFQSTKWFFCIIFPIPLEEIPNLTTHFIKNIGQGK